MSLERRAGGRRAMPPALTTLYQRNPNAGSDAVRMRVAPAPQPEGGDDHQDAVEHGVGGDHPDQRERARARKHDDEEAHGGGEQAREADRPRMRDRAAVLECVDDFEDADRERPEADDHHQHDGRLAGPEERHETRDHADQPDHDVGPAPRAAAARAVEQRERAVDDRIGAPDDGERDDGEAGPHEGEHAEHDGGDAAREQPAPVRGQAREDGQGGGRNGTGVGTVHAFFSLRAETKRTAATGDKTRRTCRKTGGKSGRGRATEESRESARRRARWASV
ncbi:hypothetical protein PT2222_10183 [Paraburkholderia tropica]